MMFDDWDDGDRFFCYGDMNRVPGSPRDNKRYRCVLCGAVRQKRREHAPLERDGTLAFWRKAHELGAWADDDWRVLLFPSPRAQAAFQAWHGDQMWLEAHVAQLKAERRRR